MSEQPTVQIRIYADGGGEAISHRNQNGTIAELGGAEQIAAQAIAQARIAHSRPGGLMQAAVWERTLDTGVHYREPMPHDALVFNDGETGRA